MKEIYSILSLKRNFLILLFPILVLQVKAQTIPLAETDGVNNTFSTAMPITAPAKIRGNIFPNADVDFYSFSATTGDKVFASVMTAFSANNNFSGKLTLLGSDGATVLEADTDNGSLGLAAGSLAGTTIPATGMYYIKVENASATQQTRGYDLYVNLRQGTPAGEVEPNDLPGTATPLSANAFVTGVRSTTTDADYYALNLAAGETVFISLDLDPERDAVSWNGRLGMGSFGDANDMILIVNDAGSDVIPSEALFLTVKDAGTYYVYVDAATAIGGPTFTYNLSVQRFAAQTGYVNYPSADVPKNIGPSIGSITSTITIPDSKIISDISVRLNLNHALMADIDATLTTPTGEVIALFTDIGAAALGGQQVMNLSLNDNNATTINSFTVLKGLGYQPESISKLSQLQNRNTAGIWTLTLYDDISNTAGGTLNNWSIDILEKTAPTPATTIASEDFEATNGGFTHTGTADEWAYGTPATAAGPGIAAFTTANSGTKCWKTDLVSTYNASSDQTLISPVYNLSAVSGNIVLSYAMKYSMENATFDNITVYAEEEPGGSGLVQNLFTWLGSTQTQNVGNPTVSPGFSGGWGTYFADVSAFAGKSFRFKVRLQSDASQQYSGVAIDDVKLFTVTVLNTSANILKGKRSNVGNELQWQISCGSNSSAAITLERSENGNSFSALNKQTATAARCETPFNFTDAQPLTGKNYYRVKVVTADGKTTYTNVVLILNAEKGLQILNISPNPVTDIKFKLNVSAAQAEAATVNIMDLNGRIISRQNIQLFAGHNSPDIYLSTLAAGVYYITLTTNSGYTETIKMIKQ